VKRIPASTWAILLVALVFVFVVADDGRYLKPANTFPMVSDGAWYYAYLPGVFIHHDLGWGWTRGMRPFERARMELLPRPSDGTGRRVNKYTVGVAMLALPFFAGAHGAAHLFGYEPDGFSTPYRLAMMLGAVFYALLALVALRRLLRLFFPEWVTAVTILSLVLGTNLLHYTVRESAMSHAYSFFALALVTLYTVLWHREGRTLWLVLLAAAAGLTIVIRPSNGLVLLLPLLWGLTGGIGPDGAEGGWQAKLRHVASHWRQLPAAAAVFAAVVIPQLIYWRVYGGSWLYYSYGTEGFLFDRPAIAQILFSYRKGWLVYTPVMITAIAGLVLVRRYVKGAGLPLAVYTAANIYLVSCWWAWWYGGSFGMRALIEMSAPLSLAMASLLTRIGELRLGRPVVVAMVTLACALNLVQTRQYRKGYIHMQDMTGEVYWRIFCRWRIPREELKEIHTALEPPDKNERRHRTHRIGNQS
jgi:hypothetical protein